MRFDREKIGGGAKKNVSLMLNFLSTIYPQQIKNQVLNYLIGYYTLVLNLCIGLCAILLSPIKTFQI